MAKVDNSDKGAEQEAEKKFRDYLVVDKNNLDTLWEWQPRQYMEVAELYAQATMEVDRAKEALTLAQAVADKQIRLNPEAFGIAKITEATVQATISTVEAVKAANDKFLQARYRAAVLQAARDAMGHKRDALEALTRLWHDGYWAEHRPALGEEAAGRGHIETQAAGLNAGMAGRKLKRP